MTSLLAAVPRPRRAQESTTRRPAEPAHDLASAVLAVVEAEADAAADALHDGALQALVVARYAADAAVRGGDVCAARDAVQEALVALRRAVWELRPRGSRSLVEALQQLAAHRASAGAAPLHLDVDDASATLLESVVPAAVATAAYRFVQRAAGSRPMTVQVRRTVDGVRLSLDVPVRDAATEALRARAVGLTLRTASEGASLHLPLRTVPARHPHAIEETP